MPRVMEVIETVEHRGLGTAENPFRKVRVYYTTDGIYLAEYDEHSILIKNYNPESDI